MATLDDLRGAFTLLEERAVSDDVATDDTVEIIGRVHRPRRSAIGRWRMVAAALGVLLVGALITTAVLTTHSASHEATKHPPAQSPNFTIIVAMNGHTQPPGAQATLAARSKVNFRVQIQSAANVGVHNVYLFLAGAVYGLGPGDQPSGRVHILTHVDGPLGPDQAITANWTAKPLFDSSRLTLAVQFDFDFPIQQHGAEQHGILRIAVI